MLLTVSVCGGDATSPGLDTDGDGILDADDPNPNDPGTSTKTDKHSGATWEGVVTGVLGTGILVVDACFGGGCTAVDVNEAHVFQMSSDGKLTHIRFYAHAERGSTPPAWDDAGWDALGDFSVVGGGTDLNLDGLVVTDPTIIGLPPTVSRYFRIDAHNDARHGDEDYIEIRSVKLFPPALP